MRAPPSCPRWALLALALPVLALPAERLTLLPHGEDHGDAALEPGDDVRSAALELSTALRFYGAAVDSLYVSVGPPLAARGSEPLLGTPRGALGGFRVSAEVRGRSKELNRSSCEQSGIGAVLIPLSHCGRGRFFECTASAGRQCNR